MFYGTNNLPSFAPGEKSVNPTKNVGIFGLLLSVVQLSICQFAQHNEENPHAQNQKSSESPIKFGQG